MRWEADPAPVMSTSTIESLRGLAWKEIEPGVERFDARLKAEGVAARLVLWRFSDESSWEWSLATSTEPQAVSRWVDQTSSTVFAVNAGYFHADGLPSGWVRTQGRDWGKRRFDPKKSGIVQLGVRPDLLFGETATSTIHDDAFQSYPWILRGGTRSFMQETGQYARRTFVGTDTDGRWYVGVIPLESVTLYQLGSLLQEAPVAWSHVLNLDGGPSTGLVSRIGGQEDRFDSFAPVSYVIVAKRRL